jgi:hypothetical protein
MHKIYALVSSQWNASVEMFFTDLLILDLTQPAIFAHCPHCEDATKTHIAC